jgi:hypothetical protein
MYTVVNVRTKILYLGGRPLITGIWFELNDHGEEWCPNFPISLEYEVTPLYSDWGPAMEASFCNSAIWFIWILFFMYLLIWNNPLYPSAELNAKSESSSEVRPVSFYIREYMSKRVRPINIYSREHPSNRVYPVNKFIRKYSTNGKKSNLLWKKYKNSTYVKKSNLLWKKFVNYIPSWFKLFLGFFIIFIFCLIACACCGEVWAQPDEDTDVPSSSNPEQDPRSDSPTRGSEEEQHSAPRHVIEEFHDTHQETLNLNLEVWELKLELLKKDNASKEMLANELESMVANPNQYENVIEKIREKVSSTHVTLKPVNLDAQQDIVGGIKNELNKDLDFEDAKKVVDKGCIDIRNEVHETKEGAIKKANEEIRKINEDLADAENFRASSIRRWGRKGNGE